MNLAATISLLEQEGFTTEQIVKVMKCIVTEQSRVVDDQAERRRAADRERKRGKRLRNSAESAEIPQKESFPHTPFKEIPSNEGIPPIVPLAEPDGFDAFWQAYPKRDGNADRKGALKAFVPAVKRAGGHELVVRAAARYAVHCRDKGKIGTEFVKQARSWLNGDLWREWLPQEPTRAAVSRVMVREGSEAWDAWKRTGRRFNAMDLKDENGHVIGRGWYFETEFPPEVRAA